MLLFAAARGSIIARSASSGRRRRERCGRDVLSHFEKTTFGYLVWYSGADLLGATRKFVYDVRAKTAEASPKKDAPDSRKR